MNKWLELSEGLYMFGQGGVTRLEPYKAYLTDGKRSEYITELFMGTARVGVVKDSIEDILQELHEK